VKMADAREEERKVQEHNAAVAATLRPKYTQLGE